MKTGNGLLAVWMDPPQEMEDELNRWYEEEHLADRMSVPGFLSARRYVCLRGTPRYFAFYELDNLDVLAGDAYQKLSQNATPWTRRVIDSMTTVVRREYELLTSAGAAADEPAPFTLLVHLETEPEHEGELNDWYDNEHLAALAAVPGVLGARRYRAREGSPRYMAVYDYANAEVRESEAWKKAADTPWTLKMRPRFIKRDDHLGRLLTSRP